MSEQSTADATPSSNVPRPAKHEPSLPYWLRVALSVMPLPITAAAALRNGINDPDTYWHLAAGQWLPTTWQFVGPEPWSAASSNSWIFHEWIPQLAFAEAFDRAGIAGVSWVYGLGVALVGFAIWFACRQQTLTLLTGVFVGLAGVGMIGSLTPRPHLVSFALAAVYTGAWLRTAHDGRARWWLVPVMWLWACSHGMWIVGLAISGFALLGIFLDHSQPEQRRKLIFLVVATAAAPLLTPAGPSLVLAPFRVNETTHFIQEWRTPSITDVSLIAVLVMAALVVVTSARSSRRLPWTLIFLLALGVGLALLYARTVAVGAAIVAPVSAAALQPFLPLRRELLRRPEVITAASLVLATLLLVPAVAPKHFGTERWGPSALSPALADLPADTVVCNDYGLGGWLLWEHPHLRPAIDGRVEVYSLEHVERYFDFVAGAPGWERFSEGVGCTVAVLAEGTPVLEDLHNDGWRVKVTGDDFVISVAPLVPAR